MSPDSGSGTAAETYPGKNTLAVSHAIMQNEGMSTPRTSQFQFSIRSLLYATVASAVMLVLYTSGVMPIALPLLLLLAWFLGWGACLVSGLREETLWDGSFRILAGSAGLIALAVLLLTPAVYRCTVGAGCSYPMQSLVWAMHSHEGKHRMLPPAYVADATGQPMHSWRVALLPFLNQMPLYQRYLQSEPWDGPNNALLHGQALWEFKCPIEKPSGPSTQTSFLAVTGPGTIWDLPQPATLVSIGDGTSNTILLVEVHGSGVPWIEPRDLHVAQMNPRINAPHGQGPSSSHERQGAHVAFADGSVRFVRNNALTTQQFRALLTANGGEKAYIPID